MHGARFAPARTAIQYLDQGCQTRGPRATCGPYTDVEKHNAVCLREENQKHNMTDYEDDTSREHKPAEAVGDSRTLCALIYSVLYKHNVRAHRGPVCLEGFS